MFKLQKRQNYEATLFKANKADLKVKLYFLRFHNHTAKCLFATTCIVLNFYALLVIRLPI